MNRQKKEEAAKREASAANRDAISGAPGAHPVGTGIGAAGGAVAGAALGALAGPVGAAIGLTAGAVAGGLMGKGAAERMDPTVEDTYWKTHFSSQKYVERDSSYDFYQPAYRVGYEGRAQYPDKKFEDVEIHLQRAYEKSKSNTSLGWDKAKHATRDAWDRVESSFSNEDRDDRTNATSHKGAKALL